MKTSYQPQFDASTQKVLGFSLVELLVVIVILGILTVIALPSYLNWIQTANRADAMATLAQDQTILERCYGQNFAYNKACAAAPAFPQASPQGFYTITLTNLTASTYTLTATATGTPQTKDTACISMSLDQANQKTALDTSGTSQTGCWNP